MTVIALSGWPPRSDLNRGVGAVCLAPAFYIDSRRLTITARHLSPMGLLDSSQRLHAARARLVTAWQRHPLLLGCVGVTAVILIANPYLLNHRGYLYGDAVNNWLWAFRWYGAAGRAGFFADFFPFAFSGFSHGWSPEFGLYNPLYHLCGILFPDSTYSVKLCYLILLNGIFALSFLSARDLRLSRSTATYVGVATLATGFVVGHAQHLSYLSSAVALLAVFAGLLSAGHGRHGRAALLVGTGIFEGATAGYPTILLFGAQVLLLHTVVALWRRRLSVRGLGAAAIGVAGGLLLAGPAIIHAWRGLSLSRRAGGLPVEQVLDPFGSLPLGSLFDLLWPYRAEALPGVDISMDRFHALLLTTVLVAIGVGLLRSRPFRDRYAVPFITLGVAAALLFVLACGDHLLPLRRVLAELSVLYRLGRFPGAEHQPFALFFLILASAFVLEYLGERRPGLGRLLLLVAVLELGVVYVATTSVRLTLARRTAMLGQPLPRLKASLEEPDQGVLDRPRFCETIPPDQYQEIYSRGEPTWWGYSAMRLRRYERERQQVRHLLCGGGRLFTWPAGRALAYRLRRYEPGLIEIEIPPFDTTAGRGLIWAETTDGYWQLTIEGQEVPMKAGPAALRQFELPEGSSSPVHLRMTYRGPLSRVFR